MNRRDAAQDAHGKVERFAFRRQHGPHRNSLRVDVDDEAEEIAPVERARLHGNIRGGVTQPQIGLHLAVGGFGDHLARAILIETVQHDAVEAGERADLPRRFVEQSLRGGMALQPCDDRA
jgi:hypothetical protein